MTVLAASAGIARRQEGMISLAKPHSGTAAVTACTDSVNRCVADHQRKRSAGIGGHG
jgi:hypothetical protein